MDLKDILPKKKEEKEYYWSVVIESGWVQSGIWRVEEGKVEVVSFGLPLSWQKNQDLVEVVDSSLSVAIQDLASDVEPSKTVFGLPSSWVEGGQIKLEYQEKIKRVCQELSLKPVGFVSLTEAIAYYLKSQEGDFLSAVIVASGEEDLGVSLVVRGETKGETQVSRSVSLVEDLVEGLSRFSFEEPLPPRIILYDGRESELEDLRQSLINADWNQYQTVKFLHPPKIEIVKPQEKVLATSLAGGVELEGVKEVKNTGVEKEEVVDTEAEVKEDNFQKVDEDLGFVVGEDIKKVSEDVIGTSLEEKPSSPILSEQSGYEKFHEESQILPKESFVDKIKNLFHKKREKVFIGQGFTFDKRPFIYGIVVLLIFFVGGFLFWWFVPSADVKIYVSPQKIEESADLKLDKSASSLDLSSRILPAREVKKDISGEKTIQVTGTKVVGDKAKGKVQIYRTGDEVKLTKGTKLQSTSGLVFTLDDDVTVASGSASSPSKTEASVTAFDIGAEYNLASGESFSVGNYASSTIEAKNEEAFSGGSSREISAVSAKDYDNVLSDLKKELEDRLVADVESSLGESEMLVKASIKDEVKDKNYNHKIGDEANDLKLDLTLSATMLVVSKNDFYELAKEILKEKVPSGYALRQDQLNVDFSLNEEKDGTTVFKTNFVAKLLPKINQDEIAKSIAGRSPDAADNFLVKVQGYDRAQINIKPNFGIQKLLVLPHIYKKIHIEVEASP